MKCNSFHFHSLLGYLGVYLRNVHHSGAGPGFASWPFIWTTDCGPESSVVSTNKQTNQKTGISQTAQPEFF